MKRIVAVTLFLTLAVLACQPPVVTPTPTVEPSATLTATPSATATPTATTEPTATVDASPTPVSTPAPTEFEGFGTTTPGGDGGDVYVLNSEQGLRDCLRLEGPAVCAVNGEIVVNNRLYIGEAHAYKTLVGVNGGTLRGADTNCSSILRIQSHDVIVQNLNFYGGACATGIDQDTLQIVGNEYAGDPVAHDIVIDHNTFMFAHDEVLSTYFEVYNVTISWNVVAWGPGGHGFLLIVGNGAHDVSVHHNLMAHGLDRLPRIKANGIVDVYNNLSYHAGVGHTFVGGGGFDQLNYLYNYYQALYPDPDDLVTIDGVGWMIYPTQDNGSAIYMEGNFGPKNLRDGTTDQLINVYKRQHLLVDEAFPVPYERTMTDAHQARLDVLAGAGAQPRSPEAGCAVYTVENNTGDFINSRDDIWQYCPGVQVIGG